jgi:cold shock CspA family protein
MGRSRETYSKKEVRNKKEKKRKEKEQKRLARKEEKDKKGGLDDMIAYVDENGVITSTPPDPTKKKKEIAVEDIEVSVSKTEAIEDTDGLRLGKLITYYESKGFGFIRDSETDQTLFVHVNDFLDDIKLDDKVSFKAEKGKKGPVAVNVSLVK